MSDQSIQLHCTLFLFSVFGTAEFQIANALYPCHIFTLPVTWHTKFTAPHSHLIHLSSHTYHTLSSSSISPRPTTATTFNHTSVRHCISILQKVATSTKITLHNSVFRGAASYDPYIECHAMKKDSVIIRIAEVLILKGAKSSKRTWVQHDTWFGKKKAGKHDNKQYFCCGRQNCVPQFK